MVLPSAGQAAGDQDRTDLPVELEVLQVRAERSERLRELRRGIGEADRLVRMLAALLDPPPPETGCGGEDGEAELLLEGLFVLEATVRAVEDEGEQHTDEQRRR